MSKTTSKPRIKIVLKKNKAINKIWHPESTLVFKSSKEKMVIGRYEDGELIPLDEETLDLCTKWKFKYDSSLVEEEEETESDSEGETASRQDSDSEVELDAKKTHVEPTSENSENEDDPVSVPAPEPVPVPDSVPDSVHEPKSESNHRSDMKSNMKSNMKSSVESNLKYFDGKSADILHQLLDTFNGKVSLLVANLDQDISNITAERDDYRERLAKTEAELNDTKMTLSNIKKVLGNL